MTTISVLVTLYIIYIYFFIKLLAIVKTCADRHLDDSVKVRLPRRDMRQK